MATETEGWGTNAWTSALETLKEEALRILSGVRAEMDKMLEGWKNKTLERKQLS